MLYSAACASLLFLLSAAGSAAAAATPSFTIRPVPVPTLPTSYKLRVSTEEGQGGYLKTSAQKGVEQANLTITPDKNQADWTISDLPGGGGHI
ncbi:hypothetical protein ACJ72_06822, partial [Emergomyces africanus]